MEEVYKDANLGPTIQETNSKEFNLVRQRMLIATDYVEFRASTMQDSLVNNYMSARQSLRDMTDTVKDRMDILGHEFVTRDWIKEQILDIVVLYGSDIPEEFRAIELY